MLVPVKKGKPKFFIDLRALFMAIRDDAVELSTLWEGAFYYLECTKKDLEHPDSGAMAIARSVFRGVRTSKGEELAEVWRTKLLKVLDKGFANGRVAWRERSDVRRLELLQQLLRRARGGGENYQEIEARDFFAALPVLRYYCDVIG